MMMLIIVFLGVFYISWSILKCPSTFISYNNMTGYIALICPFLKKYVWNDGRVLKPRCYSHKWLFCFLTLSLLSLFYHRNGSMRICWWSDSGGRGIIQDGIYSTLVPLELYDFELCVHVVHFDWNQILYTVVLM